MRIPGTEVLPERRLASHDDRVPGREVRSVGVGGAFGGQQEQNDESDDRKEEAEDEPTHSMTTLTLRDVVDPDHDEDPDDESDDAPES